MCTGDIMSFTTRPPAVTHVLGSGRNVGALREGRRLSFWSLGAGHCRRHLPGDIIFF